MMRFMLTTDAVERSRQTIQAAEVFHDKAQTIARLCAAAAADDVVVAVVERNGVFGGAWPLPRAQLHTRVEPLEAGGWVLVFSPGTRVEAVEARCLDLARLAFKRWEAMRRWASRHT